MEEEIKQEETKTEEIQEKSVLDEIREERQKIEELQKSIAKDRERNEKAIAELNIRGKSFAGQTIKEKTEEDKAKDFANKLGQHIYGKPLY